MQAENRRMIVIIDNYDSFTYNLTDLVARKTAICVVRNDSCEVKDIIAMNPQGIIISPGPGKPAESGISAAVLAHFWAKIPILGVCLGHQLLAEMTGGKVEKALKPVHGKTSLIEHSSISLFHSLPNPLNVMRYHSLIVAKEGLPLEWEIIAETAEKEIMAMKHRLLPIVGVQFHPESILTAYGDKMIENWLAEIH